MNFETIKRNYDRKLWSRAQVKVAVRKGVITPEDYKTITGEQYQETSIMRQAKM